MQRYVQVGPVHHDPSSWSQWLHNILYFDQPKYQSLIEHHPDPVSQAPGRPAVHVTAKPSPPAYNTPRPSYTHKPGWDTDPDPVIIALEAGAAAASGLVRSVGHLGGSLATHRRSGSRRGRRARKDLKKGTKAAKKIGKKHKRKGRTTKKKGKKGRKGTKKNRKQKRDRKTGQFVAK